MRVSGSTPTISGLGLAIRRAASALRETVLLAMPVAALEVAGKYSPHDGTDLVVLCGAGVLVTMLVRAAHVGWLPATTRLAELGKDASMRLVRALSPRYAVAFRRSAEVVPVPDRTLLVPIAVLTAALVGTALLGHRIFEGLSFLKLSVSYTLYLAGITAIWGLLFLAVVLGAIAAAQWVQGAGRGGGRRAAVLLLGVCWLTGLIGLYHLPGSTPLALLLVMGALRARSLGGVPSQNYLFCRRDAQGRPRTIPVHVYLHRVHAAIVLLLAVILVVGQSRRLWYAAQPHAPFFFTTWLAILASLCSLILVGRAGVHFQRILGGRRAPPETPLTPTLWIKPPEGPTEPWRRLARDNGWHVVTEPANPSHEYDLVLGDDESPRRFVPRPSADEDDARFQLERRYQVVMRRRFHRHFRSLYKQLRGEDPEEGSGFLFCPHVWLVPGVVRDVEPKGRGQGSGSLSGPVFYGPPYAEAFPHRVRRYIGGVLRDLQVDIVYWEDAVGWPDIRRVLGVAFEIYDQRRSPLEARHFIGLPRVRVVIQEEDADPDPARDPLRPRPPTLERQAPGHARILLIVRDRGDHEELDVPEPADSWIRTPTLV